MLVINCKTDYSVASNAITVQWSVMVYSRILTVLVVMLVFEVGFTARVIYEDIANPATPVAYAQDQSHHAAR